MEIKINCGRALIRKLGTGKILMKPVLVSQNVSVVRVLFHFCIYTLYFTKIAEEKRPQKKWSQNSIFSPKLRLIT